MASDQARQFSDDPRGSPEFEALLSECLEELNRTGFVDPDLVLAENPRLGPALLEDLKTFVQLRELEATGAPLGTLGDYTLRRQIGRGGMGVVYEAWQNSMDRQVALKVMPKAIAVDTRAVARFIQEAQLAGKLNHPNIVHVHGMGVEQQIPYYAMDFVEGETLAQIVLRLKDVDSETETPFGHKDAASYFESLARAFADVADGLQHAHAKKVIHRDIKPSNLILDGEGHLRILDFGLARLEGQEGLTVTGDFLGTPQYMSPEQARRSQIPVDHRTDVYSLGATLYEMLTLQPPFRGKDHEDTLSQIIDREPPLPHKINSRVPPNLETIVLKCLRKEATDRYGTAEALGQDLRRFVRGDAIEARPPAAWGRFRQRVLRHRRKLYAAAGVSALLLLCGVLAWRLRLERETSRLYLDEDYEKRVIAAAMKLLRAERVLATTSKDFSERANILSPRYQNLLSRSGKLVAEEAVAELTRSIADLPDRFEGFHYRAKGLRLLGNDAGASADVKECLRRNPTFLPAKALLSDIEASRDEPGVPLTRLATPAPAPGDRWGGAWLHAHRAMWQQAWKEAVSAYGELLDIEEGSKAELFLGSSIENLIGRGVALMETKDFEGAKRDFWAAQTLSRKLWGEFLEPVLLLGKVYVLERKPSTAEEIFREALDRSGDREKMSLWVAAAYQSLLFDLEQSGRTEEAVAAARKAVQFHPEDGEARLRLGWTLLRDDWWRRERKAIGAPDAGPDALQEIGTLVAQVIARNPNDAFAYALWSKALEAQGKLDLASELAEKAGALLGGADLSTFSRSQDMSVRDFASTAAVAAALTLGLGVEARAHEPAGTFTDVKHLEINSPFLDEIAVQSGDGLTLAFGSDRPGGSGGPDIYIADRQDVNAPFTPPRNVAELNTSAWEGPSFLSDDGLTLYFNSNRSGPSNRGGQWDMYFSKRPSRAADALFGEAQAMDEINSPLSVEYGMSLTADGLEAYFSSNRPGGKGLSDTWVATRSSVNEPFAVVRNVEEVNTASEDVSPSISADGLTLFWSDSPFDGAAVRPGGKGGGDIWCASRSSRSEKFGNVRNVGSPINTSASEVFIRVSPQWPEDESIVYFNRCVNCDTDADIYQATWRVTPPASQFLRGDANADGKLDLSDGVTVLNHLFLGAAAPACMDAADANDDGKVDLSDAVFDFGYLFLGKDPPPSPGPSTCGPDPTQDVLSECVYDTTKC